MDRLTGREAHSLGAYNSFSLETNLKGKKKRQALFLIRAFLASDTQKWGLVLHLSAKLKMSNLITVRRKTPLTS